MAHAYGARRRRVNRPPKSPRPIKLAGSCQCGKVSFDVVSETPYPFMFCYCSLCRKTTGALTANIMGKRDTLKIRGAKHLRVHHAVMRKRGQRPTRSSGERW